IRKRDLYWRGRLWVILLIPLVIPDLLCRMPSLFGVSSVQHAPVSFLTLKELVVVMPRARVSFFARLPNSNVHLLLLSAAVRKKKRRYFTTDNSLRLDVDCLLCCPLAQSINSPR